MLRRGKVIGSVLIALMFLVARKNVRARDGTASPQCMHAIASVATATAKFSVDVVFKNTDPDLIIERRTSMNSQPNAVVHSFE